MRAVIWEGLLAELGAPDPGRARLVADLADRLGYVCASILASALDARSERDAWRSAVELAGRSTARPLGGESAEHELGARPGRRVVLIDERADAAAGPSAAYHAAAAVRRGGAGSAEPRTVDADELDGRRHQASGSATGGFQPAGSTRDRSSRASKARPLPWEMPLQDDSPGRAPS